jgi:hypothetical protein
MTKCRTIVCLLCRQWTERDLNPRRSDLQPDALPTELSVQKPWPDPKTMPGGLEQATGESNPAQSDLESNMLTQSVTCSEIGGTRTPIPFGTATSTQRVYQNSATISQEEG